MIEKFTQEEVESVWMEPVAGNIQSIYGKVNELIDAVNTIQKEREAERFEIQEWIGIIEAVRKSVNIHEKQIDELQMKVEPHKCEPAENIYTETCRMDKEFAEEELDRTRKALDVAVDALKMIGSGDIIEHSVVGHEDDNKIFIANKALEQITALEQKDVK